MIPKRDSKFYQNIECYLHRLFPQVIIQTSSRGMSEESRQTYISLLKTRSGCVKSSTLVHKMSLQEQYLLFLLENDFKKRVKDPQTLEG